MRRRLIRCAVALPLLVACWYFSAYPRGMLAAWNDTQAGHYEVKTFGLPAPWARDYRRLVQERYGVAIYAEAGCVVSEELVWYVQGYNSVSKPRITARFGKDIFAECAADAKKAYKRDLLLGKE